MGKKIHSSPRDSLAFWNSKGNESELNLLVRESQNGNTESFERIVALTIDNVYALALRLLGDKEDASDVVQEAYIRAFKSIKGFKCQSSIKTWLYRITANCCYAYYLKKESNRKKTEILANATILKSGCSDPEMLNIEHFERQVLKNAIKNLPPQMRMPVVLKDIYGFSHEEVATELGITVSAAKVRLHRARKLLREALDGYEVLQNGLK